VLLCFYVCIFVCLNLPLVYFYLFTAKKQKEETPEEMKSGSFVFSNGDRYGMM